MTDDLWGELPSVENIRTPHAIMMEQAQLLTDKTKGLLQGTVVRTQENNNLFVNTLYIRAPSLSNYAYAVCTVRHAITLYPVSFIGHSTAPTVQVQLANEEAFLARLGLELSSTQTVRVITGLLAQIRADLATKSES